MQRVARLILAAAAASIGNPAGADKLPAPSAAYSADITLEMQGHHYSGHINVDSGKERREIKTANAAPTIMIIRRDKNRVYDLRPQRHLAVVLRMAAAEAAGQTGVPGIDIDSFYTADALPQGADTIGGQPTTRYRITMQSGPDLTVEATVWVTADGIVVKSVGNTSVDNDKPPAVLELTNIKRGPQDPALFELPPGMSVLSPSSDPDTPDTSSDPPAK